MKHIYGFDVRELKLEKIEVVKETKGRYIVNHRLVTNVNKSNMETYDYKFYPTYQEAVEGLIHYCKWAIDFEKKQIEYAKAQISIYKGIIFERVIELNEYNRSLKKD